MSSFENTNPATQINEQVEEWIKEKSKNANNPFAYAKKLREEYIRGTQEAIEEFEAWKKSKEQQERAEQVEQQVEQIEHADFSIFVQNPQILQSFFAGQKEISFVADPGKGISTIDICFIDGRTAHVPKAQLYPILLQLQQEQGGAA